MDDTRLGLDVLAISGLSAKPVIVINRGLPDHAGRNTAHEQNE
jgi:hypothetical protein